MIDEVHKHITEYWRCHGKEPTILVVDIFTEEELVRSHDHYFIYFVPRNERRFMGMRIATVITKQDEPRIIKVA